MSRCHPASGAGADRGTVSVCGLLLGRLSRTGGRMYRPGSGGFYGQIRHRHLLLLQRGRPLMQDYSELVAHPTDTEESIAVQDGSQHSDSPRTSRERSKA